MDRKFSLNRTQLKLIAIVSMVIDHVAWGFVDFYSPLGQFMHVLGRFTIPIMCFFIAEGFRRTHDLRQYIYRMASAAVFTIIPFYLFFGHEYGYRQNIIFDYLLGLLMLTVLEKTKWSRAAKILAVAVLFGVSVTVGGWIITPSMFILVFYYGRDWKQKVKLFVTVNVVTVLSIETAIFLNSRFHFMEYDWTWWSMLYLLGFMLALPVLSLYNGEKGSDRPGSKFFYIFYPAHFIILWAVQKLTVGYDSLYGLYLGIHILVIVVIVIMLEGVLRSQASRGQNAVAIFLVSGAVYVCGFVLEILASSADGYYLACIVQYFGEYIMLISILLFISEACRVSTPRFVYLLHIVVSLGLMYALVTTRETGFFYSYIGVNNENVIGRPELVHATGFWLSLTFMAVICLEIIIFACFVFLRGSKIEKRRMILILCAMVSCWMPILITATGITGGFEIPAIGMLAAGGFMYASLFRYGALDSVALASENALEKAHEGILVLDDMYRVSFHNRIVDDIIGELSHSADLRDHEVVGRILNGEINHIDVADRVYEVTLEELKSGKLTQGTMIWFLDVTEHIQNLRNMQELAHHDPLTGLYNRGYFKKIVDDEVAEGRRGCFLMMDMDNFKMVNDRYGHQRGDSVLINLASILKEYPDDELYACRVGGDEFCAYIRDNTDKEHITSVIDNVMTRFNRTFRSEDDIRCTISIGAVINDDADSLMDCSAMYSHADKKLYEAKESGKNTYRM